MYFYIDKDSVKVILKVRYTEERGFLDVVSALVKSVSNSFLLDPIYEKSRDTLVLVFPFRTALSNLALQGIQGWFIKIKNEYRPKFLKFAFPGSVRLFTFNWVEGISPDENILNYTLFLSDEVTSGFVDSLKDVLLTLICSKFAKRLLGHSLDYTSLDGKPKLDVRIVIKSEHLSNLVDEFNKSLSDLI